MHHSSSLQPSHRSNWSAAILENGALLPRPTEPFCIGVLPGEGIGPDVIGVALKVLQALPEPDAPRFDLIWGGEIGTRAKALDGQPLTAETCQFCHHIFARGGAILNGPGGDRYVYDLRREFDLFCKISPLQVVDEITGAGPMKAEHIRGTDILIVRDNAAGLYQGPWRQTFTDGERRAEQSCAYTETQTRRIVTVAARLAAARRGKLCVVVKEGGVPTISQLWRDVAEQIASETNLELTIINVDHMAYALIQAPCSFDVVVTPNMFGDVLADLGSVLIGSRGNSFSGNFDDNGAAVYQTNHGSGYDLVGKDLANPVGQIFSLAMLLRESFGLENEARRLEAGVAQVWRDGWRTFDVMESGCQQVGTVQMGELIAEAVTNPEPPL